MRLTDIKDDIDAYFDSKTPEQILEGFKQLGYEFEPIEKEQ